MENNSGVRKSYSILLFVLLSISSNSCCWFNEDACKDCFEKANLFFPSTVSNLQITRTFQPTYIGFQFYPQGTVVGVLPNVIAFNEFFSIEREMPGTNIKVIYFWNRDTPPAFTDLQEGELITFYKTVVNRRIDNSVDCIFQTAEEVKSILDVKIKAENGEEVGRRTVEQTIFNIPAGQYATFNFEFEYLVCGNYEFNIEIDPEGRLTETSVKDNNFSEVKTNFCF
nr:hypothetical protein [uncultured Allomuricauda sp.]